MDIGRQQRVIIVEPLPPLEMPIEEPQEVPAEPPAFEPEPAPAAP
jgi:hypothetical protein